MSLEDRQNHINTIWQRLSAISDILGGECQACRAGRRAATQENACDVGKLGYHAPPLHARRGAGHQHHLSPAAIRQQLHLLLCHLPRPRQPVVGPSINFNSNTKIIQRTPADHLTQRGLHCHQLHHHHGRQHQLHPRSVHVGLQWLATAFSR